MGLWSGGEQRDKPWGVSVGMPLHKTTCTVHKRYFFLLYTTNRRLTFQSWWSAAGQLPPAASPKWSILPWWWNDGRNRVWGATPSSLLRLLPLPRRTSLRLLAPAGVTPNLCTSSAPPTTHTPSWPLHADLAGSVPVSAIVFCWARPAVLPPLVLKEVVSWNPPPPLSLPPSPAQWCLSSPCSTTLFCTTAYAIAHCMTAMIALSSPLVYYSFSVLLLYPPVTSAAPCAIKATPALALYAFAFTATLLR